MLAVNSGIQDRLINGQTGNISYIEFAQGSVRNVYVKFSDGQASLKAMKSSYLGRKSFWVPVRKCELDIPIKKGSAYTSINSTQFSLILTWGSTVHQVQGLSLGWGVIDFDQRKQKSYRSGQIHTLRSLIDEGCGIAGVVGKNVKN